MAKARGGAAASTRGKARGGRASKAEERKAPRAKAKAKAKAAPRAGGGNGAHAPAPSAARLAVPGFTHFGGRHGESAALANILGHAGLRAPHTERPFSEALCFGIAGGIGAGYSFCPSVVRWGAGSGVSLVGRHKAYATDAAWYEGFTDRLGVGMSVLETGGAGKAEKNLRDALAAGRPGIVFCAQGLLPFCGDPATASALAMHSFPVFEIDDAARLARGSDRAATPVEVSLEALAAARGKICSHRNRLVTLEPPKAIGASALRAAIVAGLAACARELLEGKIRTYSLPGLELLAKMIANDSAKEGWRKVFAEGGLVFTALRDAYDSIETAGTGGGLFRPMYADFLDEAGAALRSGGLADLAARYRELGRRWSGIAEAMLPSSAPLLAEAKALLGEKRRRIDRGGPALNADMVALDGRIAANERAFRGAPPLGARDTGALLESLRDRIGAIHQEEKAAAAELAKAAR